MNTLQICPPHLSDVATLPWEILKKVIFQHYYSYTSDYIRQLRRKQTATVVLRTQLEIKSNNASLINEMSQTF